MEISIADEATFHVDDGKGYLTLRGDLFESCRKQLEDGILDIRMPLEVAQELHKQLGMYV